MTKRPLTAEQREELERLWKYAVAFIDYGRKHGMTEMFANDMEAGIRGGYEDGDLRGLREQRREIDQWVREMPKPERARVNALLEAASGFNVSSQRDQELRKIRLIEAEGRITTEDDYRLVEGRIEEIGDDPAHTKELEALTELLEKFKG